MHEIRIIDGREVPEITEEEASSFKIIGTASGPDFGFCVYLGWKHTENFLERVAGYSISMGGLASMIDEAQEKAGLDKPKYINVTFYENRQNEQGDKNNLLRGA
jgi:hypothetical protein